MKIFRSILQICKKILMAFSRIQRNVIPVIVKQIAAINRRKPDYSGYFGAPEGIRTPDTRLRRAVLCPAELLARIQFLFVSVTPAVENPPNVRRRPLYPTELRGQRKGNPPVSPHCQRQFIIGETGGKVNANQSPSEMPIARAERMACASLGTNFVLPATSESAWWVTVLPAMPTA